MQAPTYPAEALENAHANGVREGQARYATSDHEGLARLFHETYERLAPQFGYKTREASAVPWEDVPDSNKRLMVAVAGEVEAANPYARSLSPFPYARAVMRQHFLDDTEPGGILNTYHANIAMLLSDRSGGADFSDPEVRDEAAAEIMDLVFGLKEDTGG